MRDSLASGAVEPLFSGRFGRPYLYEGACSSPRELLDPELPEGAVAVCDHDGAPPGAAVVCSVLLRPPEGRRASELPLVGAMAVADAVEGALTLSAQIKWPAEIMVNRRQVGAASFEDAGDHAVLEARIDVNQAREEVPSGRHPPVASLYAIDGVRRERAAILAAFLARVEVHYERWRAGGIDAIYDFLGARDFLRGRAVAVDGTRGYAIGIDREGRLEIEVEGQRRLVESGEVTYER